MLLALVLLILRVFPVLLALPPVLLALEHC
jgi:hypothetical protein